jgi:hypothetical protein
MNFGIRHRLAHSRYDVAALAGHAPRCPARTADPIGVGDRRVWARGGKRTKYAEGSADPPRLRCA